MTAWESFRSDTSMTFLSPDGGPQGLGVHGSKNCSKCSLVLAAVSIAATVAIVVIYSSSSSSSGR